MRLTHKTNYLNIFGEINLHVILILYCACNKLKSARHINKEIIILTMLTTKIIADKTYIIHPWRIIPDIFCTYSKSFYLILANKE